MFSMLILRRLRFTKIEYDNGNPYLARWQMNMPHAFSGSTKYGDPTKIKEPTKLEETFYSTARKLFFFQFFPHAKLIEKRFYRCADWYQLALLPTAIFASMLLSGYHIGFKLMTLHFTAAFVLRLLHKTADPIVPERELYNIIYANPQIAALFKPQSVYALEYECEFIKEFPPKDQFPLLHTRLYRLFNCVSDLTEGQYTLADLDSGATMVLKFKTMPIFGKYMFSLGDFFYFYDLRAEINHKGQFKEIILRDQSIELQKKQLFLLYI